MKTALQVQGMMCAHCENRVIQACSQLDGVSNVQASAAENNVVCDYDETKISLAQIKAAIEEVGYDVK